MSAENTKKTTIKTMSEEATMTTETGSAEAEVTTQADVTTTTTTTGAETAAETAPETGAETQAPEATPEATTEATASDVAAAMAKAYAITEPEPEAEAEAGAEAGGEQKEGEEEYQLSYPENWNADPAFTELVTPIAKKSGIDGKTFGALTAEVIGKMQEAEYANMVKTDAELKKDWGADYDANMKAARAEAAFLKKEAGLTDEDLRVFASPKGMRALYAISLTHGEKGAAGMKEVSASDKAWAEEVMTNPAHPDYKAFHDVNDPRWRLVNERYNRAKGI